MNRTSPKRWINKALLPWLLLGGIVASALLAGVLTKHRSPNEGNQGALTFDENQRPTPADKVSPLQKLIEEQKIPSPREMPFLNKLADGLIVGRTERKPVVYIRARSPDDPEWTAFLDALEANILPRAVFGLCVRVIRYQEDLSVSPIIEVHSTEPVTPSLGHYEETEEGKWMFVVSDTPSAKGFQANVTAPTPGATLVFSPDGSLLMRHRLVEFFAGVDDIMLFGRRVWSVFEGEIRLDELTTAVAQGRASEEDLRLALSDEFFGLITTDLRIQAMNNLLAHKPQDMWAVHRILRVIFGPDITDPLQFLPQCREAWPEQESAARQLFESQVDYYIFKNNKSAIAKLETAAALVPGDPNTRERLARFCLIQARESSDPATRTSYLDKARVTLAQLRLLDARYPDLLNLERALERMAAEGAAPLESQEQPEAPAGESPASPEAGEEDPTEARKDE